MCKSIIAPPLRTYDKFPFFFYTFIHGIFIVLHGIISIVHVFISYTNSDLIVLTKRVASDKGENTIIMYIISIQIVPLNFFQTLSRKKKMFHVKIIILNSSNKLD